MQLWTRNVRRVGISATTAPTAPTTARAPATHLVAMIERGSEVSVFEVAMLLSWHGAGEDLVAAALVGGGGEVIGGRDAGGGGRGEEGGGRGGGERRKGRGEGGVLSNDYWYM